jgi:hypothetical protein
VKISKERISGAARAATAVLAFLLGSQALFGQSFDFPAKTWGISFGNSKEFTGLRFNFRDSQVVHLRGVNVTLWQPRKDNKDAVVEGLSLGVIPGGGDVRGPARLLGVGAEKSLRAIRRLLRAGAAAREGINIGGLVSGGTIDRVNLGGFGVGSGGREGINVGGLGVGAEITSRDSTSGALVSRGEVTASLSAAWRRRRA